MKSQTIEKAVKKWCCEEDRGNAENLHLMELFSVIAVDSGAFY